MAERAALELAGRVLLAGEARAAALVLSEPLSFWGGLDPQTGLITERRHPQHGQSLAGRVLVMHGGRGSSSSSSVLAEALRNGRGPVAILLSVTDEIILIGALAADLLYGLGCPVVEVDASGLQRISTGDEVQLAASGRLEVRAAGALT